MDAPSTGRSIFNQNRSKSLPFDTQDQFSPRNSIPYSPEDDESQNWNQSHITMVNFNSAGSVPGHAIHEALAPRQSLDEEMFEPLQNINYGYTSATWAPTNDLSGGILGNGVSGYEDFLWPTSDRNSYDPSGLALSFRTSTDTSSSSSNSREKESSQPIDGIEDDDSASFDTRTARKERRREQNRLNQRAFRERQSIVYGMMQQKIEELHQELMKLGEDNKQLRETIHVLSRPGYSQSESSRTELDPDETQEQREQ